MTVTVLNGDCRAMLATLPTASVQCCVTSPPYYGLRDYGVASQIGLEPTPNEYVAEMVDVFRAMRRVLRDDGTVWLNLGDSYNGGGVGGGSRKGVSLAGSSNRDRQGQDRKTLDAPGYKSKDLLGIPWRVAFALQADGWYLRSAIIWHKPNPMPESVRDRPTSAHEMVFLLAKSDRYFYDADAVAEEAVCFGRQHTTGVQPPKVRALQESGQHGNGGNLSINYERKSRNLRNVWTIAPKPYKGAHFATMPPALAERCIKAGSRPGDVVLDPFGGAGTTGVVASRLGRDAVLIDLNAEYCTLARSRIEADAGMLAAD